jgi:hypothetical protein
MIIQEEGVGDIWSDIGGFFVGVATSVADATTKIYRAVNPFVTDTGEVKMPSDVTQWYRELNPFVGSAGNLDVLGLTSLHDIPVLGQAQDITAEVFGINWNMNDSPQWRVVIPIAEAAAAMALTIATLGGAAGPIAALFGGGSAAIAAGTVGGTVLATAGSTAAFIAVTAGKDDILRNADPNTFIVAKPSSTGVSAAANITAPVGSGTPDAGSPLIIAAVVGGLILLLNQ